MLQWDSMHPYNAAHVARVPGKPDLDRLRLAVRRTLEHRGLAGLRLDARQRIFHAVEPVPCEVSLVQTPTGAADPLAGEIERQLNRPFPLREAFCPCRFFVMEEQASFALGLCYLHAMADAESVLGLMKEIVSCYSGAREHPARTDAESSAPINPLLSHPDAVARKLAAFPGLMRDMSRSHRPAYRDELDLGNTFRLFRLDPERLRLLVATAKSWGITVNDLLLAMLLKSCAPLAIERGQARRRRNLSVGCIVNTRRDLPRGERESFGLFLGSFVLTHPVSASQPLKELAMDVVRKTLEIKRKKIYLATSLELSLGRILINFFSPERRKKLYQKHYPLWGGLTNMNINTLWPAHADGSPVDYLRGVSTGPATPLVISFTTAGASANIGLSCRSTVFSPKDIERFMGCFLAFLDGLEVTP